MMRQIEVQFVNKNYIKFLYLSVVMLFSNYCVQAKDQDSFKVYSCNDMFLMEQCVPKQFSFCNDGYWGYQRQACFVKTDSLKTIFELYDKGIFLFPHNIGYQNILSVHGVKFIDYETMRAKVDSLRQINNSIVRYYSSHLKKNVNDMYRRSNVKNKYNGYLNYEKIKLNIKYVYIGKTEFTLPNIEKNSRTLYKEVLLDTYLIISVDN